jgi:hypothetical protein
MKKLDWTRLLGFNQVESDRETIREVNLASPTESRVGGRLGSKLGSKPGAKAPRA